MLNLEDKEWHDFKIDRLFEVKKIDGISNTTVVR